MRQTLIFASILAACGSANAAVTLAGGEYISFSGFDAPAFLLKGQHTGLENSKLMFIDPLSQFTATFIGKEATHQNQFLVNGVSVFSNLAVPGSIYVSSMADGPISFAFLDATAGEEIPNGGKPQTFMSYAVLGTRGAAGDFVAATNGGQFDYILGLNDGGRKDADFDDMLIGVRVVTSVPEPETYALMLAGLGVVGAVGHRRRKTQKRLA